MDAPTPLLQVRCTRPMQHAGRRIEPGQVLELHPIEAHACVVSTRAEFVHPQDRALCDAAVRAADERATPRARSRLSPSWVRNF